MADPKAMAPVKTNNERIQEAERTQATSFAAPTLGTPAPVETVAQEKAQEQPKGVLILTVEELADVERHFNEAKDFKGINKAYTGLPEAWQEIPEVIQLYQKKAKEVRDKK